MSKTKFYKKYYQDDITETDLKNIEKLSFSEVSLSLTEFDPCINLVDLYLSKCVILSPTDHFFKKVTITQAENLDVKNIFKNTVNLLDLSANNLTEIQFLNPLINLHTLILVDNNLTTVDSLLFEKVPNLDTLDLSYNNITEIPIVNKPLSIFI